MASKKRGDSEIIAYILGIISIVMAFFTPLAGLIFGIIGLVQSKKQETELSKKAKKLNIIGIVLSILFFIIIIIITTYFTINNLPQNFPLA